MNTEKAMSDFRRLSADRRSKLEADGYLISGAEYEVIYDVVTKSFAQDWMTEDQVLYLIEIGIKQYLYRRGCKR